ncbi:hypothetical protein JEQ12_003769 [Ovis aries]|uniref:Uncharacterized protein n=1 Tax=Ovis aries TaxID=9940 RepID=A0A836CYI3_SHEEP|nr:hypothetical protein JEQ12_003769 [Ovis aries]
MLEEKRKMCLQAGGAPNAAMMQIIQQPDSPQSRSTPQASNGSDSREDPALGVDEEPPLVLLPSGTPSDDGNTPHNITLSTRDTASVTQGLSASRSSILKQNKNSELAETNLTSALWGPLFTTIFCSPRSLLCHQTFEEGKRDREEKAETATALAVLLLTFPCEISPRSETQECVCTPQAPSLCLSEADDWSQSRERNRTSQGRTLSKERDCPIIDLWSKKYQVTNESFC